MQVMIDTIKATLVRLDSVYDMLCQNNTTPAMKEISEIMPGLNGIITKLISEIPYYRQLGVDLPEDVIIAQLNNLLDAFEQKDMVMLADSLKYELSDTLQVYEEILTQLAVEA